jgi:hypothetical protein
MPMALDPSGQYGHVSLDQGGKHGARHAGQDRLGEPVGQPRAGRFPAAA